MVVTTKEGKTFTRRIVVKELLTHETVEVVVPAETHAESARECPDLTTLDDQQLSTIVKTPELRERIVKLIEETKQTEQTKTEESTTRTEHAKKTAQESRKGSEKRQKVADKRIHEDRGSHQRHATQSPGRSSRGSLAERRQHARASAKSPRNYRQATRRPPRYGSSAVG